MKTKNLTLYTETQLLLLVGDVAADCAHQRHGDGADNSCDGAHLGRRLCGRAPSRGANRCVKWKETKSRTHSPLLSSYWLIWSLSPRGCPPMERRVRVCFFVLMHTYSESYACYLCLCQVCTCRLCQLQRDRCQ